MVIRKNNEEQLFTDGHFKQNGYGDCINLAGIDGLINTPAGRAHANRIITPDGEGNYTVNLPNRPAIEVTDNDLKDPRLAISDDKGIKILEKAALKVNAAEDRVEDPAKLFGGQNTNTYMVRLFGNNAEQLNDIASTAMGQQVMTQVAEGKGTMWATTNTPKEVKLEDGSTVTMPAPHGYGIHLRADGNFDVHNPHDTSKPIKMSREELGNTFSQVFVSETPGNKITFDPSLQKLADASAQMAAAEQAYLNASGAFNLNADQASINNAVAAAKKDIPPHILQNHRDATANLTQEIAATNAALKQPQAETAQATAVAAAPTAPAIRNDEPIIKRPGFVRSNNPDGSIPEVAPTNFNDEPKIGRASFIRKNNPDGSITPPEQTITDDTPTLKTPSFIRKNNPDGTIDVKPEIKTSATPGAEPEPRINTSQVDITNGTLNPEAMQSAQKTMAALKDKGVEAKGFDVDKPQEQVVAAANIQEKKKNLSPTELKPTSSGPALA